MAPAALTKQNEIDVPISEKSERLRVYPEAFGRGEKSLAAVGIATRYGLDGSGIESRL